MYQGRETTNCDHVDRLASCPDFGHVYTIRCGVFQRTLVTFSLPSNMQSIAIPLMRETYERAGVRTICARVYEIVVIT